LYKSFLSEPEKALALFQKYQSPQNIHEITLHIASTYGALNDAEKSNVYFEKAKQWNKYSYLTYSMLYYSKMSNIYKLIFEEHDPTKTQAQIDEIVTIIDTGLDTVMYDSHIAILVELKQDFVKRVSIIPQLQGMHDIKIPDLSNDPKLKRTENNYKEQTKLRLFKLFHLANQTLQNVDFSFYQYYSNKYTNGMQKAEDFGHIVTVETFDKK